MLEKALLAILVFASLSCRSSGTGNSTNEPSSTPSKPSTTQSAAQADSSASLNLANVETIVMVSSSNEELGLVSFADFLGSVKTMFSYLKMIFQRPPKPTKTVVDNEGIKYGSDTTIESLGEIETNGVNTPMFLLHDQKNGYRIQIGNATDPAGVELISLKSAVGQNGVYSPINGPTILNSLVKYYPTDYNKKVIFYNTQETWVQTGKVQQGWNWDVEYEGNYAIITCIAEKGCGSTASPKK